MVTIPLKDRTKLTTKKGLTAEQIVWRLTNDEASTDRQNVSNQFFFNNSKGRHNSHYLENK